MHTLQALEPADFRYRSGGETVPRDDVLPSLTPDERVGVVMARGTDGIGAGNFLLSCVISFYDRLSAIRGDDFFEYPDYYTFQTTDDPADYAMLDIYPDHKNVTVDPDAEALLRAINDRAITVLLVPETPAYSPDIADVTRRSAERRLTHCFLYAPDGQPSEADVAIQQPRQPAAEWYDTIARSVESVPERDAFPSPGSGDPIVQQFREISIDEALSRLPVSQ